MWTAAEAARIGLVKCFLVVLFFSRNRSRADSVIGVPFALVS
jgi:hypothetical protein